MRLLAQVVHHADEHGSLPAYAQDERFATRAPMIKRTVSLTEENTPMITSLVVTVIGPDRPGIVSLLSAKAQGFGANWAGSRMASLAGHFAGMVHFEVPPENADALPRPLLKALESSDLRILIEKSGGARGARGTARGQASRWSATTARASCATCRARSRSAASPSSSCTRRS